MLKKKKMTDMGCLGGSDSKASAFGSGHDPWVLRLSPASGSPLSRESASPSPSPSAPHPDLCTLSLSLHLSQIIKSLKKKMRDLKNVLTYNTKRLTSLIHKEHVQKNDQPIQKWKIHRRGTRNS